ncbi:MAG: hypothetical protein ACR2K5_08245 [Pseudolabrys sp.]
MSAILRTPKVKNPALGPRFRGDERAKYPNCFDFAKNINVGKALAAHRPLASLALILYPKVHRPAGDSACAYDFGRDEDQV